MIDNPQLLLAVQAARGQWSAYEVALLVGVNVHVHTHTHAHTYTRTQVEEVRAIHTHHYISDVVNHGGWGDTWRQEQEARGQERGGGGDIRALVGFVDGCLMILEALQTAGIVHNDLNVETMLVREVRLLHLLSFA